MATRLYSLYCKIDGKHYRVSPDSYVKATAVRIFQNELLAGMLDGASLRPVKPNEPIYRALTSAYGRKYTQEKEVTQHWTDGLDFMIQSTGQYCSIRDGIDGYVRLVNGCCVIVRGRKKKEEPPCDTATT